MGWRRLESLAVPVSGTRVLVETFPLSAWRFLGLPSVPAKKKARETDIARHFQICAAAISNGDFGFPGSR